MVAAGGSLPEVFSCIAEARLNRPNIVLGNIAGSQIFNLLAILGISAMTGSFLFERSLLIDILFLIGLTVAMFALFRSDAGRGKLGYAMVGCYLVYALILLAK